MRSWCGNIFLFISILFSIFARPSPQIQTFNTDVASSYATPDPLFFDAAKKGNIILVMRLFDCDHDSILIDRKVFIKFNKILEKKLFFSKK